MRRNWGTIVATELATLAPFLLAGCAEAPPPEPVAPPPPTTAAAPAPPPKKTVDLSDPPDAKPGLGAFVPIVPVTAASELAVPHDPGQVVAFGKGVIQLLSLTAPPGLDSGACLVTVPDGAPCQFLRFAPWKQPRDRAGWERPARDNDVGAWSAFVPAAGDWGNLSPGAEAVYALRREGSLAIDTIDEKGKVTPVFDGANAPAIFDVRLVETATGLLAIGIDPDTQSLAAVALRKKDGGGFAPSPATQLHLTMTGDEGTAQQARWMIDQKLRVGYGSWDVLAGVDDKGKADKSVYMAWTEAIPPAKYAPRGVVKKGHGVTAKHGCGGRPSRPLFDASVEKKTHLTVLGEDGRVAADHVLPIAAPLDSAPALALAAIPGGVEVNGVRFGKDGKPKDASVKPVAPPPALTPPPLVGPVMQRLEAAAFDPKSGEGIIVYSEKDDQRAMRFDARGAPIGAPVDVTNRVQLAPRAFARLARAGETWVALEQSADAVVLVNGPNAGKRVAIASDRSWVLPKGPAWVFPVDDAHVEVVRFVPLPKTYLLEIGVGDPALSRGLMVSTVDVTSGNSTPWSLVSGWFAGEAITPRLNDVAIAARASDGGLLLVGRGSEGSWREVRRNADGGWAAPVLLGEGGNIHGAIPHSVWGDVVAVLLGSTPLATWLEGARTLPLQASNDHQALRGPLLAGGAFALPATTGAPVKLPAEVARHVTDCPLAFPTGPNRTVMVCDEPVDAARVSVRVGLRTVRY